MAARATPLRPRERLLALCAGGLISVWAVLAFLIQPLWDRSEELQLQLDTQTERLNALATLLRGLPDLEQKYQEVSGYLTPDADGTQAAFLDQLETLSREAHVRMNLKPRDQRRDERVSRFAVEVDVEGDPPRILAFLDQVLRLPRLMTVERLRIASVQSREPSLRANLVLQHLTLND